MKKLLAIIILCFTICASGFAQENTHKVKKTSTLPQKVHNIFSRHKKHSGYKSKREKNGIKRKHKVNYKTGEVTNKKKAA